MKKQDIILIGGGIVGISTALQLKRRYPEADILLLEKEDAIAQHQTGRNSGVIHAGVYYQPGSLKADFCRRGAAATMEFCGEHGLPFEQCGKLLVATSEMELERMESLEERCAQNSIEIYRLSEDELKKREPAVTGIGALFVPATGISDYSAIASRMVELFISIGGQVKTGRTVTAIKEECGEVEIRTDNGSCYHSSYLIACGGLGSDRIAKMTGIEINFQIVPFRGEYFQLPAAHNGIVNHLVYPIPDPDLPFLGVHLTRMIDGSVTIGPNAVVGWKREGYGRFNLDLKDSFDMLTFPGFWRGISPHLKSGFNEFKDSFYKRGYLERVRKYCPGLTVGDLRPYPVGIRAQAVKRDGTMVHDFLFVESDLSFHVCNAPSPAATSAIPIGEYICDQVTKKFKLSS